MSITHCPLCVVLAVVSTARGLLHALQLWQLLEALPRATPSRRLRLAPAAS
jgi:hypothetical protein